MLTGLQNEQSIYRSFQMISAHASVRPPWQIDDFTVRKSSINTAILTTIRSLTHGLLPTGNTRSTGSRRRVTSQQLVLSSCRETWQLRLVPVYASQRFNQHWLVSYQRRLLPYDAWSLVHWLEAASANQSMSSTGHRHHGLCPQVSQFVPIAFICYCDVNVVSAMIGLYAVLWLANGHASGHCWSVTRSVTSLQISTLSMHRVLYGQRYCTTFMNIFIHHRWQQKTLKIQQTI